VTICRVHEVPIGALFVLVGGQKGSPICLRAAYKLPEEEADEANRVVPIHWPEEPTSVGVAIYASALTGHAAVVLESARLEVNPLSARVNETRSLSAVYGRAEHLFFPVSYHGQFQGFVDAESGEILPSTSGIYVAFDDWDISVSYDGLDRLVILPVDRDDEEVAAS